MNKPPIGLTPKYVRDELRKTDITNAIERFVTARKPIPIAWVEEWNELMQEVKMDRVIDQLYAKYLSHAEKEVQRMLMYNINPKAMQWIMTESVFNFMSNMSKEVKLPNSNPMLMGIEIKVKDYIADEVILLTLKED